jgi:hypothetical protein
LFSTEGISLQSNSERTTHFYFEKKKAEHGIAGKEKNLKTGQGPGDAKASLGCRDALLGKRQTLMIVGSI